MMNKDREWAFIELGKLYPSYTETYEYPDDITVTKCELLNKVYDILSQLDEPEVLSQEWIDNNSINASSDGVTEEYVHVRDLQNLLVPKQELPLLPKYMHEWITNHRDKYDLYPALKRLEGNPLGWERFYTWYRENTHTFVNAYLTGEYEVEEEQKYYVLFGSQLYDDNWTYALTKSGSIEFFEKDVLPEWDRAKLTEQEIKDYDPRYWAFAEPVGEVEE